MLEKLKHIISNKPRNSVGIELFVHGTDKFSYRIVKLDKQTDEIKIIHTEQELDSLSKIKKHLKFDTPISISIQGKGILNKVIENNNENYSKSLLSQVLPNAKADDFYIQQTKLNDNKNFISVIRKSQVKSVLESFAESNINICDLSISYHPLLALNELISIGKDFSIQDDLFVTQNDKIIDIVKVDPNKETDSITIGSEELNTSDLLPFSSAFLNFFNYSERVTLSNEFNSFKEEFKYRILFRKVRIGILTFFLLLLMINYLLFQKTNSTTSRLSQNLTYSNSLLTEIENLNADIQLKERMVRESGFLKSYYHAYMADRIALTMPKEISLLTLEVQRPFGRYEENEKCTFDNNSIQISGYATHSNYINVWLNKIKSESWVNEVNMIEYSHETEQNTGYFIIKIKH